MLQEIKVILFSGSSFNVKFSLEARDLNLKA